MEMYADEFSCVSRIAAYQYAEYTEMAVCVYNSRRKRMIHWSLSPFFCIVSYVDRSKFLQIRPDSLRVTLLRMGLPDSILKIMESYLETFEVEGSDFWTYSLK